MLCLDVLQAQHGDCLLLRYGTSQHPKVMIIDGGPKDTWKQVLLPRLQTLSAGNKLSVPLVMVSHIDDDHIHGVIDYFGTLEKDGDLRSRLLPAALWHNSLDQLTSPALAALMGGGHPPAGDNRAVAASFKQGNTLREQAHRLKVQVNYPNQGEPILAGTIDSGHFGLSLRVVSPDAKRLKKLRAKWQVYNAPQARTEACKDQSLYNLSSMVVLVEQHGKRILLTGDARGDHVVKGLKEAGLLDAEGKIHVDVYKVSHHGSNKNSEPATFETIFADHYVVSGDQVAHPENPSSDVIEWIVQARRKSRPDEPYTIWMTYDLPQLKNLVTAPGRVVTPAAGETFMSIELA